AYEDMVVTEYLEFFAAAYNIHGTDRRKVVGDVLELTDLTYKATAEVNSLSRGMQQRLSVARVLLHDPQVLLMDEPASGLDPRARIEIRELLKELKRMGKTILISSHILHELAELCNVVGIIEKGQLLFNGSVEEILRRARVGHVLHLKVVDRIQDACELLRTFPGVKTATVEMGDGKEQLIHVHFDDGAGSAYTDIPNVLVRNGFRIARFTEEPVNLETAFMRLTKGLVQ
ncbi:MAG: ABC transporter ATP-binding protein, partial [Phycisphaerales bacterium]|nr:ABC transporter ATP-binding protein [Phycisphaerales bacterium]